MRRARVACRPGPRRRVPSVGAFVRLFKALADETRLEIVALLATTGGDELCVCDIERHFDLSQPTISHHLRILREAGLVTFERRGTWIYYRIDPGAVALLDDFGRLTRVAPRSRAVGA